MSLFDVRRSSVEKEMFLGKIYDSGHPRPDIIQEDASLYGSDQGVTNNLNDVINNYSDFEDMEKHSHHMSLKRRTRMKNTSHK